MSGVATLLEAAEFLERRDRELEHGYASTRPMPDDLRYPLKRPKSKKSHGSRTSHNELEKNRRAHLRNCLEKLKEIVPLEPEASRHTTLGLLTRARRFIKSLEDKDKKKGQMKEALGREQRYLRRRLDALGMHVQPSVVAAMAATVTATASPTSAAASKRRSVSECSSSTISSSHSSLSSTSSSSHSSAPSPISETDEVDVIGYTSTQSDTDDHSSVQSASSDSGVTMSTSRLTISEMREAYMI